MSQNKNQLDDQWVVGFTDGEGCFNLDVHVKKDMRWGLQMQPEFTVVQHERDKQLLEDLKTKFQCGSVGVNRKDDTSTRYHYRVKSVRDLTKTINPFFEKNELRTQKKDEFEIFKEICSLMKDGYHLESLENFLKVDELGQSLRRRSGPKRGTRGVKVEEQVKILRERLKNNPDLK